MKVWNLVIAALVGLMLSVGGAVAATTNQSPAVQVVLIPIHVSGQYTASTTAVARYKMPFACTLIGASASARASGGTSPTLAVNVKEAGTTVLSSTMSITAGSVTEGTISDSAIADEAELTVDFTIGGSSPTWNDISILLTCVR
ncbi:MAG: hypothetical protein GC151_13910 [Betaproteobacteria bacterium]|nr:hypothetical protein [Betaproteobacteria bacterium]